MTISYLEKMLNNILVDKPAKPEPVVNHTDRPVGLALPQGARMGPNCGVTAVAIVCGLTFDEAWNKLRGNRNANWKGRTYVEDLLKALYDHGIKYECRREFGYTLHTFVKCFARPGVRYIVRTSGHVQVVKDGWAVDQLGSKPIASFWGRRKRVSHVIEIVE